MNEISQSSMETETTEAGETATHRTTKEKYSAPEIVLLSASHTRTGTTTNVAENSNGYLTNAS